MINRDEETRWEAAARTRWGSYITAIERRFLLRALDLASAVGDAIEVGAEGGRWSKVLYNRGWNLTLTDIEPEAIEICRRRLPAAKCILVNPEDTALPIEDESVDMLICIEVPTVIWQDWFIAEAVRVLRHGGILVGVFQNKRSARGFVQHIRFKLQGGLDYYPAAYAPWRKKLRQQGFHILEEEGLCWFPFRRESNSLIIEYFTRLERYLGLRRLPTLSPWVALVSRKGTPE